MHDHHDTSGADRQTDDTHTHPHTHEHRLSMFGRSVELPRNRIVRITLGILLCLGGFVWFLPVVGIWMLPVGIAVLSIDIPSVRRHSHRVSAWFHRRYPKTAEKLFPKSHHP